jgi:hypothetical protein
LYVAIGSSGGRRREGADITTSLTPSSAADSYTAGNFPGAGTYFCVECGVQLALQEDDRLPDCPRCGSSSFQLDSIFESMQEHGATTAEFEVSREASPTEWLEKARAEFEPGSRHLLCREDDGKVVDFELSEGWTRIGRSISADLQLDDPSVSRRHALIVSEPGKALRVLDDRSLNGVFVNGDLVEWGRLSDGDELAIGRYRLFAIEA